MFKFFRERNLQKQEKGWGKLNKLNAYLQERTSAHTEYSKVTSTVISGISQLTRSHNSEAQKLAKVNDPFSRAALINYKLYLEKWLKDYEALIHGYNTTFDAFNAVLERFPQELASLDSNNEIQCCKNLQRTIQREKSEIENLENYSEVQDELQKLVATLNRLEANNTTVLPGAQSTRNSP